MAGTFPTLSSGSVALYPVVRNLSWPAKVVRFLDDTEQRWISGVPLNRWTLALSHIKWADVQTLQTFFNTQKGAFDPTWTFGIDGASWTSMAFDQDDFTYTEISATKFSVALKLAQTQNSGTYSSGLSAVFPAINGGIVVQYPFTSAPSFLTTRNDMDTGLRYAWYWRTTPLFMWTLKYPNITDSECVTLFNFYASMRGNYSQFSFTDPETSAAHPKCRFGGPIQRTYTQAGLSTVDLVLVETA